MFVRVKLMENAFTSLTIMGITRDISSFDLLSYENNSSHPKDCHIINNRGQ